MAVGEVIAQEVAFVRLTTPGLEYWRRAFVHEQTRRLQMAAHAARDMEASATGPVARCRPIEPDPLPCIDLA